MNFPLHFSTNKSSSSLAFLFCSLPLKDGLRAIVNMACVLKAKSTTFVSKRLSEKFGKLWLAAEVILFVLVGAAVDIRYTLEAGLSAVLMILLLQRHLGRWEWI